jgi:CRISPR-associated endonuclease Csn1
VIDYTSPFQLRKELAEEKFDFEKKENRYKLGRALYHIAQRRGFKSSRKGSDDIKEKENDTNEIVDLQYSEKKKNKVIVDYFVQYPDAKTIGSLFATLEDNKIRIRESVAQHAIRENYKDEIKYIFQNQNISFSTELYAKLVESGKNKNDGSIFYKRPLRSQKGLIGKCTLEPNKYRAPISHPSFEIFRSWSFLNNIKYKSISEKDTDWKGLSIELKQKIYNKLFFRKSKGYFPFSEIEEFVKKENADWILNYKSKTTVTGCPVSARLKDIFGDDFLNVRIEKEPSEKSKKNYYDIEDIWHILFSFEDQEYVTDFATDKLKLNQEQTKQFITAWNAAPVGYAMLSLNAINKINHFLVKGLIYTEAVLLANIPEVIGKDIWKEDETYLVKEIGNIINNNREQKQTINVINNLISKHKNLEAELKFGHKDNTYKLDESDIKDIETTCEETFGIKTWAEKTDTEKQNILDDIKACYQSYFTTTGLEIKYINGDKHFIVKVNGNNFYKAETGFYRSPKLKDTLSEFLETNFSLDEKQLEKIYHPSEINIYPPAKEDKNGILKLGSPKTGSFKNPMAMRALHELRKLMNYLVETKQINQETRLVVEVARELNDANKRWAIETYQKRREEENNEFAKAIEALLKNEKGVNANTENNEDIDKMRIWYEQNQNKKDDDVLPPITEDKKEIKGVSWQSVKKETYKEILSKKELIDKYRLWLEQQCMCMYTGKMIKLTDLFSTENIIDFEHTIPRSISFDNSLANLTVCFSDYNRTIKKNQIPYNLNNFHEESGGHSAIEPRLKNWKEKVERIKQQIDFWVTKSRKAADKEWKDKAIRERHLWQMELDYWKNKVDRFTMKEVTTGFKNSQKVDTQLISKYAFHYLKTYFDRVDVQKGSITAEFRKIYALQVPDQKKDRSKHSHHAKDAAVLTLIPIAVKRDVILKEYYEHKERKQSFVCEPYKGFSREFVWGIDDSILINNISNNQALTLSKKIIRKRGKIQFVKGTNKPMIATGDCIRGQLHDETFFGAIKLAKKDDDGKFIRDEEGNLLQEEKEKFVLRVPFQYKNKADAPGFKTLEEIEKVIVDRHLFNQIKKQTEKAGSLKEAFEQGIFMFNKKGEKENKIRRIRIFKSVTEPLKIKKQTYLSKHEYKQHYYAGNATNSFFAIYEGDGKIDFDFRNLFDTAKIKSFEKIFKKEDLFEKQIHIKKGNNTKTMDLKYILEPELKVVFKMKEEENLKLLSTNEIIKRMYKYTNFEKNGNSARLNFNFHLEARNSKDIIEEYTESEIDFNNPKPSLRFAYSKYQFAVENYDFEIKMDGTIEWMH